jgi:hypothetical protein
MSEIDDVVSAYSKHASLPWIKNLAAGQRTWMIVYSPSEERRLRARLTEFENVTKHSGKEWCLVDVTDSFGEWLDSNPYRDRYFANPNLLNGATFKSFREFIIAKITSESERTGPDMVVALVGIASLFPFTEVSGILEAAADQVPGRLLVFFPGEHRQDNYRLLGARDGWNYLATAITAKEG